MPEADTAMPDAPAPARLSVLLLTDEMEVGGTQRQIVQLARGLDPDGFRVTVGYFRNPSFLVDELRGAGIEVVRIDKTRRVDLGFLRALRREIAATRCDVLHCFSYTAELWGALACRLLPAASRPALISSIRGTYEWYTPMQWRIKRWVTGRSAAVISNSRQGADYAADRMAWPRAALTVVHNGVDPIDVPQAAASRLRGQLMPGDDGTLLLFVGRLVDHKNLPRLIEAFAAVTALPNPVQLLIVGDGPLRAELAAQVTRLGVADRVRLLGERRDVAALMAAADIVVLPSLREGLSNVILEAMMAGRPVIASTAGGNSELVADGETGLTFPAEDAPALSAAIRRLACDPTLRRTLGERGRSAAMGRFSPAAMTVAMQQAYRHARPR